MKRTQLLKLRIDYLFFTQKPIILTITIKSKINGYDQTELRCQKKNSLQEM
jgi:hypothetical protein